MASLFGKNKLREIALKLETSELESKIALVKTWHQDYHHGSLKADKETSREQAYNQDFFIQILGYKEKPAVPYSFEPKATTDKGQLPDAVLGHTDVTSDIKNIAAVVELKGAGIELDRPQRREGNMSPVQQGFKYKTQYRNCPFVVVSNFWEFRLYHDNQLDYELWTLDDLVDPEDDYLKFKTWYTLLHSDNLTTPKGASKTEGWLSDIRFEQEEIGKKFYKVYREARTELLRDIYQHNEVVRSNIDLGIEKAQKIIDRIVFACFAEDRGLLPDDTLRRVIQAADTSTFGGSLWSTFKGFFEAIDTGSDKLEIPNGYNGGLFAPDPELNALKISDEPLRKVAKLSDYNFVEDLSVTILGHIFEQSISDLEEIKSKVEESNNLDTIQQSRRKKDGIFYTPDYIVRYIVDNSLGAYLREEEERLKDEFKLKEGINDKNYEKRERQAYTKYQDFLQSVKVVDPACGSGAFLVYVFDYLLAENKRVENILGSTLFSSDEYVKSILQNNIYGVDLNDESVEITKLSLWLKSAQKGKKLTTLDGNIKCGNSLIDDPTVAGDKAFNWREQFAEIFKNGGFDVVVGNPPYVKLQSINSSDLAQTKYFESHYEVASGRFDLYVLFLEKALNIIKENGIASYILPHKFLGSEFGNATRKYLAASKAIKELVHFGSHQVFADASTYTCILSLTKNNKALNFVQISPNDLLDAHKFSAINYSQLNETPWRLIDGKTAAIINKVTSQPHKLNSTFKRISRGVVTGADSVFILKGSITGGRFYGTSKELGGDVVIESELMKPILMGSSVSRYTHNNKGTFLLYAHILRDGRTVPIEENALSTEYPLAYEYLLNFKDILVAKKIKYKTNPKYWYSLHNSREVSLFQNRKIVTPYLANRTNMTIDSENYYTNDKCTNLVFKDGTENEQNIIAAILNSKLTWFFVSSTGSEFSGGYFAFTNIYLEPITLPDGLRSHPELGVKVEEQMSHSRKLNLLSNQFETVIRNEFNKKAPNKWYSLDFDSFISSLKLRLSLTQKDELLQLFNKYANELQVIDSDIQRNDREIDRLVYDLYSLSSAEVAVVEGSDV
ncbi:MAG: N-6 DNA methylase [Candidatus Microsaccharimonas sp.]